MIDEEKKAIERLNKRYEFFKENPLATNVWLTLDIHNLGIALNLIEKQSKEIEELKMKLEVEKIDNKYNREEASEEMIPRYKIKARIKELEKYRDKFDECNMLKNVIIKQNQIQVLQSLLEKE